MLDSEILSRLKQRIGRRIYDLMWPAWLAVLGCCTHPSSPSPARPRHDLGETSSLSWSMDLPRLQPLVASGFANPKRTLYQHGLLRFLWAGAYSGTKTAAAILSHGTLGVGAGDALSGEVTVVDGVAYLSAAGAGTRRLGPREMLAFAEVVDFVPQTTASFQNVDQAELAAWLVEMFPEPAALALRIHGDPTTIRARAPRTQSPPFPPLSEVIRTQSVFDVHGECSLLVGFRLPASLMPLSPPGLHLHFVSCGHTKGGHVLDVQGDLLVEVAPLDHLHVHPGPAPSGWSLQSEQSQPLGASPSK